MRKWILWGLVVIAVIGVVLRGAGPGGWIFLGAMAGAVLVVNRRWNEKVKGRFRRPEDSGDPS